MNLLRRTWFFSDGSISRLVQRADARPELAKRSSGRACPVVFETGRVWRVVFDQALAGSCLDTGDASLPRHVIAAAQGDWAGFLPCRSTAGLIQTTQTTPRNCMSKYVHTFDAYSVLSVDQIRGAQGARRRHNFIENRWSLYFLRRRE
jgi:hypothetical protein